MPNYFTLLIENELVTFEKSRVISIENHISGTQITLYGSNTSEEPITWLTTESYEKVMEAYLS